MTAPKPIYFVNLALAAFLAWACYGAFAPEPPARVPVKKAGEAQSPEPAGGTSAQRSPRAHYNVIERANIFKNKDIVARPPEPTPAPPTPVPLSPLPLELKGTSISPKDNMLKAAIFNTGKRTFEYYGKNDVIPDAGGAKITEITRNKVTIDRQGQVDTLQTYPPDPKQLQESTGTKGLKR